MEGQTLYNTQLESAVAEFVKDRQKDKYARLMELLETSMVLVPSMPPGGLDEETQGLMREGKTVQLPEKAKIIPCLLSKENGERALPIFTSFAQIPQDKKSPVVLAMPFRSCLSMVMANQDDVKAMVLNPFTDIVVLHKEIMEVAINRLNTSNQTKTIQVTKKQFQQLLHNRVALHQLPMYLFAHKEKGLKELQHEEGSFLIQFYKESFPEGSDAPLAEALKEISVMTLNITEDMQITRVDMPAGTEKMGMCYRVYVVWMRETQELRYYTLEKTEQGNYFGQIIPGGKHELVEPAPDNGAEIEAVMNLVTGM